MRKFRDFLIIRNCKKKFKNYHSYKPYLRTDFHSRCAYCNTLDSIITTPFEVDHFIPRDIFKEIKPEYAYLYENLIYACKKCNDAKGNAYQGDINNGLIENELFYDPTKIDYGQKFYRDNTGTILSNDSLAKDMINKLKLYRPIHNMAWLCELIKTTLDLIRKKMCKMDKSLGEYKLLEDAKNKLNDYYVICHSVFIENYNNEQFCFN